MSIMKQVVEIGLPILSEEDIEQLTENCEEEIARFIFNQLPEKSIEELAVSCTLEMDSELDVDIEIAISQKYDTGQDLDALAEAASEHGLKWLEERLLEMKSD